MADTLTSTLGFDINAKVRLVSSNSAQLDTERKRAARSCKRAVDGVYTAVSQHCTQGTFHALRRRKLSHL